MKNWIIKNFGLKGSWSWAKKQMIKGEIVRCKHWAGALRLKVDNKQNQMLQSSYWGRDILNSPNYKKGSNREFDTSNHHLSYEDFTDYEIVK